MQKSFNRSSVGIRTVYATALLFWLSVSNTATFSDAAEIQALEPGPCVLLTNGNVIFGASNQIGQTITVTRADGSSIQLSSQQIAFRGQSLSELYDYRKRTRFTGDLRRLQEDARWCLRFGLIRQAAQDVLLARELAPSNPENLQLLRLVAARMKSSAPTDSAAVKMVSHESEFDPDADTTDGQPPAEISPDSLGAGSDEPWENRIDAKDLSDQVRHQFALRIQPMLVNRCASCHAHHNANNKTAFKLRPANFIKWAPKNALDDNLNAVIDYLSFSQPRLSPFRARSLDQHGGDRRWSPVMVNNLDRWLDSLRIPTGRQGMETDSEVPEEWQNPSNSGASLVPADAPRLSRLSHEDSHGHGVARQAGGTLESDSGIPAVPAPIAPVGLQMPDFAKPVASRGDAASAGAVRRMPKVSNPFDPEIFNRRHHGR